MKIVCANNMNVKFGKYEAKSTGHNCLNFSKNSKNTKMTLLGTSFKKVKIADRKLMHYWSCFKCVIIQKSLNTKIEREIRACGKYEREIRKI